jgi:hypothetical protein
MIFKNLLIVCCLMLSGCASKEYVAESCGETILNKYLKAPASATFQESKILETNGVQYLVKVTVDAENSFGAKIRETYLVVTKPDFDNSGILSVSCKSFEGKDVMRSDGRPTEADITAIKSLNEWK